jgi:MerR family mercuric resistance operon transcriptional regulator
MMLERPFCSPRPGRARQLEDVRAKNADLARLERLLDKTIKRCPGKAVAECRVLDVLNANYA